MNVSLITVPNQNFLHVMYPTNTKNETRNEEIRQSTATSRSPLPQQVSPAVASWGRCSGGGGGDAAAKSMVVVVAVCYLWEDIEISNIEEGRALNSWLIGL